MNKNAKKSVKIVLSVSILMRVTASYAEMTLEQQVAHLQQQVQELQNLMQQQKQASEKISAELPALKKISDKIDIKPLVTKGGAEFEFYGNVRADASYQFKGPATMYNYISTVPLKGSTAEANNSDKLQSTLNATRLGFNFKTPNIGKHSVGGKIEMDFFGGAGRDTFRIRHAYLTYGDWLIGQTWSNFNAVEYYPETVDASLSVGGSLTRVPQVKYSYIIDKNVNFSLSLEDPKAETVAASGTQNFTTDTKAKLKLPSAVGRLNYKFDNGSALSGRLFLTQKATNHENKEHILAWGAAIGGKYQLTDNSLLRFDYNHIKGDSKNVLWSNYAYVFDDFGTIHANEFNTVTIGFTQKITSKIRSTLGFGYMRANSNNAFADLVYDDSTQNKELKQGWINVFYNPVKPINFGIEYMYGERKTFMDLKGIDNRINLTAIYDF
ncbi:DcaP family trimeric outer membrane transporter [Acinetobacter sp. SAAs470]|nr:MULTISPECIES: DcaP family trimeric outer membrane transporter [unclassified Acinetobacter]WOE33118.1 DcaP family trimeric outer membrane transporter [Acinetobacter sp. SAAs470]WOE39944.1 DcaP family trimeric outer membrane transporter [Acinetobacter sp. SAAs474]